MTDTHHTPGPLEVRQAAGINSRDYDVFRAGAPASAGKIARVHGREGMPSAAVAYARLFAAAPELLSALEYAVEKYGKPGGPWNVPSDPGGWIERARAAISKAKGEAR